MSVLNHETGELVPIHPEEPGAIAMLNQAVLALTTALDQMPISDVVNLKAKVTTVATATKELGMSKEAQELAVEAVRRAEWALGRAIRKGQEEGTVATQGHAHGKPVQGTGLPAPSDFASDLELYDRPSQGKAGILSIGEASPGDFDAAIDAAKAEGNLSRANVARKAREQSGQMRGTPRPAAEKSMNLVAIYASKAARAANELTPEQIRRIRPEADAWTVDLRNSIEALQRLVNSLDNKETK